MCKYDVTLSKWMEETRKQVLEPGSVCWVLSASSVRMGHISCHRLSDGTDVAKFLWGRTLHIFLAMFRDRDNTFVSIFENTKTFLDVGSVYRCIRTPQLMPYFTPGKSFPQKKAGFIHHRLRGVEVSLAWGENAACLCNETDPSGAQCQLSGTVSWPRLLSLDPWALRG